MNNRIRGIHLSRLRNEEYFEFHTCISRMVNDCELSEASRALVAMYNGYFAELGATVDIVRASFYTTQMNNADERRTITYRGLRSAVRHHLRHADPVKCTAAHRIDTIIHHYGDITVLSHDAKTATIRSLLQDLSVETGPDLQLINVTGWVGELEANNQSYIRLKELRTEEAWARWAPRKMQAVRKSLDDAYRMLVGHLEAHATLHLESDHASLLLTLNIEVEHFRQLIAQRQGIMSYRRRVGHRADGLG